MKGRIFLFALVASILVSGCGRRGGESVAIVNDEPITMDEFVNYLKTKDRVRIVTDQGQVVEAPVSDTLAYQALEDLVSRKLVLQLAKDDHVYPSDAEVMQELDFRKKLNPSYIQALNVRGMTMERIKDQVIVELSTEKLLTKGITVTDEELNQFIKERKLDRDPATADLLFVFVRTADGKQRVDKDLGAGESFVNVASRYSEAPNAKENGARYNVRVISRMGAELQKVVGATTENHTTPWLTVQGGFAKFYVDKKTPEQPLLLDASKREFIRREIAKEHGSRAKDLSRRLADKLFESESRIVVNPKDLQEMWKQAMERAKKERKVSIPTGTQSDSGQR